MANFFENLPLSWLYDKEQIRQIVLRLNQLSNPVSYVYSALKDILIGLPPEAYDDINKTITVSSSGEGSGGILDGGFRIGEDGLLDGGFRVL